MAYADILQTIAFGLVSALVLVGAFWVVTLTNLFRAALSLGLVLVGVAGLFLLLQAEFLAFAQILVYVGAILTMVIFAIMLTGKLQTAVDAPSRQSRLRALLVCGALFALLATSTLAAPWPQSARGEPIDPAAIGQQLVTTLVLPFEAVSLVFVSAMVGAMVLASGRHRSAGAK
jgi:NAD(P)H-quinone oxidoreductase subunit 6